MNKKPNISKYKVIIFDLFHTLSSLLHSNAPGKNTHELLGHGITRNMWVEALFDKTEDRLRGNITDHVEIIRDIVDKLGKDIPDEIIRSTAVSRYERFRYSLRNIRENTIDTIKKLRSKKKNIVLVSNADKMERSGWEESPLAEYFDHAVFSCDVGYFKPEEEIFRIAIERSGVDPSECLFVGDGGSDELSAAKKTGMDTVFTSEFIIDLWPEKVDERIKTADYYIKNINELIN